MSQRHHPAHAVVDVVAVEANEQHNNRRNCCPENLQGEIAFDGDSVAELTTSSTKTDQAVNKKPNDAHKQDCSDCEQNLKELVVNRCVHAGINRQKIDVLADPKPPQGKEHSNHQSDDG